MNINPFRLTLQNRIIILVVVSSIIFIMTFAFIQVENQLEMINRYDIYRSKLITMIAKNNLEFSIWRNPDNLKESAEAATKELLDTNMVKSVAFFGLKGDVIYSSEVSQKEDGISYKDKSAIDELTRINKQDRWFFSLVDPIKQCVYLYIGLRGVDTTQLSYVARVTMPLANIFEAMSQVYKPAMFAAILIIIANIIFGYIFSKTIIGPIKLLNEMTKLIAAGDLGVSTKIRTGDELEELGITFNHMTEELVKMKERAENANPLTKLPGNIVIHEVIDSHIKSDKKFTVIYCDLDNFKAFNDKYGIGKGDEAIKLTAEILKNAVEEQGSSEDFIGHEGGDDFLLVTTPEKSQPITDLIIKRFDERIRSLYAPEDLKQGYIAAQARDGSTKNFPIMTISMAGVTNSTRQISNYGEVTNIAAEVKKKAKAIGKSVFIMDARTAKR